MLIATILSLQNYYSDKLKLEHNRDRAKLEAEHRSAVELLQREHERDRGASARAAVSSAFFAAAVPSAIAFSALHQTTSMRLLWVVGCGLSGVG